MSSEELRALRLLAVILVGFAAFQATQGAWAAAATTLAALVVFSAIAYWRSRHLDTTRPDPVEADARARRAGTRILPLFLIFFAALAVYNVVDEDWFGAGWAGVCFGVTSVMLWVNRRRLSGS